MKPLTQEEQDFISAIQDFQKEQDKLFLSWCEVLQIVKNLGYTRTLDKSENQKPPCIYETRALEIIKEMANDPELEECWESDLEDEAQGNASRGDQEAYAYCEMVKVKVRELLERKE